MTCVRHIDVRRVVTVLALLVAGCASGGHTSSRSTQSAGTGSTASPHVTSGGSSAHVSARVILPSRTMAAGSFLAGRVVVQNNSGRAIRVPGCGTIFQVALVSSTYHPTVGWTQCLHTVTIPTGESSYPTPVPAIYRFCSEEPQGSAPTCMFGGHPPPLPPGDYRAVLFQEGHLIPFPPAVTVRVTPP
jgi:hypothetical protein